MCRCHLPIISFIALLVATAGFAQEIYTNGSRSNSQQLDLDVQVHAKNFGSAESHTNGWHFDIRLLDLAAQDHANDAGSTLARDVKRFYQLLHDKQWKKTYELRAKAFREDVSESAYLAEAIKDEGIWGLVDYDVLSIKFQNSPGATNLDTAVLICKFTELPDYAVSYSAVYWHYEEGIWKCLSAGPSKLGIFRGTRPTFVDWR